MVPTSVREDELCVNGMSFSQRNSQWANSAVVVAVGESDWQPWVVRASSLYYVTQSSVRNSIILKQCSFPSKVLLNNAGGRPLALRTSDIFFSSVK